MIGAEFAARPRTGVLPYVFALLGLMAIIMGIAAWRGTETYGTFFIAFWLISAAVILVMMRRVRFRGFVKEEALVIEQPTEQVIPWGSIRAVQVESARKKPVAIHVLHEKGSLAIPLRACQEPGKLVPFLTGFIPETPCEALPRELQQYYQNMAEKFGREKVYAFRGRQQVANSERGQFGRALGLSCVIAGIVWIVAGLVLQSKTFYGEGWAVAGVVFFLLGIIVYLAFSQSRKLRGGVGIWKEAGVVISPVGLALMQGKKTRGEMQWDELKQLIYPTRTGFLDVDRSRTGNIRLDFGGGSIEIVDVYCHPLDVIHQRIQQYWRRG